MKNFLMLFFPLLFIICNISCKSNPSSPEENLQPGRRDYIWTVDTLYSPNNMLRCISGSSPSDVWAVGNGGITEYDGLWHYDGISWQPFHQALRAFPICVHSFSSNDAWIGASSGKIFHYNGSSWEKSYSYIKAGAHLIDILDIWGNSSNNLYATVLISYNKPDQVLGAVLHYDGTKWDEEYVTDSYSQFTIIRTKSDNAFIFCFKSDSMFSFMSLVYYKYNNKKLSQIAACSNPDMNWGNISLLGNNISVLVDRDLYFYRNDRLEKIMTINEPNINGGVYGRGRNDFFMNMKDGIAHYDGQNFEYVYHYSSPNTQALKSPVILENDVFFTIKDFYTGKNLILHGKLKNK